MNRTRKFSAVALPLGKKRKIATATNNAWNGFVGHVKRALPYQPNKEHKGQFSRSAADDDPSQLILKKDSSQQEEQFLDDLIIQIGIAAHE